MPSRRIIDQITKCKPNRVRVVYNASGGTVSLGQAMEFNISHQAAHKVLTWLEVDAAYRPLKNWRDPRSGVEGEAHFERRLDA